MPASSRLTDIWTGICCCHPPAPCIPMSGPVITSSPDDYSGNLGQARLTDMTIGWCGHPGNIITSAPSCFANNLGKARIGDSVVGCNIGNLVTGWPTHFVENISGGGGGTQPPTSVQTTIEFQGDTITFTEVDFGNVDDDPDTDDGLNIFPAVVGRPPTSSEIARSAELDVSPTVEVEENTDPPTDTPAEIVACIDVPSDLPGSFQLTPNYNLGSVSTQTVLSKVQVRAQHGYTVEDIVCNLQAWCQNIGEPLSAEYGHNEKIITSGFRIGSSTSQHERGMTCDIQYLKYTNTQVYNIAIWVRDNLAYDQLLLEYGGNKPWIHISHNRFGNRSVSHPRKFGTRVSPGNYVWGTLKNMS